LKCSAQNRNAICEPVSGGRGGHPVVLSKPAFDELKSSRAATLKDFLKLAAVPRVQCEVNEPGLPLDLDTPEDYKRMQPR